MKGGCSRPDVISFQPLGVPEGLHTRSEMHRGVEGASKGSGLSNKDRAAMVEAVSTADRSEVRRSLWDMLGWRHPWTPR